MAKYNELTSATILERLNSELVPKQKDKNGVTEYYLWAATDRNLKKVLTDAQFGAFQDAVDDFDSVTMPPERENNYWLFAPSKALVDWLTDQDVPSDFKMAYLKIGYVEHHFEQDEYPPVIRLLRPNRKLYAYGYEQILSANQALLEAFKAGRSEKDALSNADEMVFGREDVDFTPVKNENEEDEDLTDVFEPDEDENELDLTEESDEMDPEFFNGGDEAPFFDDETMNEDMEFSPEENDTVANESSDEIVDFGEDAQESSFKDDDVDDFSKKSSSELPLALQHLLAQIEPANLKASSIKVNDDLDDYHKEVDDARQQINEQLNHLSKVARQNIIARYYEKRAVEEHKVDARLDPEKGDKKIVDAWKRVQEANDHDSHSLTEAEEAKRKSLESRLDDFRKNYIQQAIAQAEKEWEEVKESRYIEEPIQKWRASAMATLDTHEKERQKKFHDWRQKIRDTYLSDIDLPIIKELSPEIQREVQNLNQEQSDARRELGRIEERLFNRNLEMERLKLRQGASPDSVAPLESKAVDEPAAFEKEAESASMGPVTNVDKVDDEDEDEFEDEAAQENESSLEKIGSDTSGNIDDDEDEFDFPDTEEDESLVVEEEKDADAEATSSDELAKDAIDEADDFDPMDFSFDEEDDSDSTSTNVMSTPEPVEEEQLDLSDFDGKIDLDDDEPEKLTSEQLSEPKKSKIDDYVGDGKTDIDESNVVSNVLDNFEEEKPDEDVPEKAESSKKKKGFGKLGKKFKGVDKKPKSKGPLKESGDQSDDNNSKKKKKLMMIVGGAIAAVVIVFLIFLLTSGGSSNIKVNPSPTNTYSKGILLSGKQGDKNVSLIVKEVKGNKLVVSDVQTNKTYTVDKPKS